MNHGGFGYISNNYDIYLPPNLVNGLSLNDKSILSGIIYKSRFAKDENTFDLVFSPIPERMWSRTCRMLVRLNNQPQSLHKFTKILNEKEDISIYFAECTRSGHGYATWNIFFTFEDESFNSLLSKYNRVERHNIEHKLVKSKLKNLLKRVRKDAVSKELLYEHSTFKREMIIIKQNKSLRFFHKHSDAEYFKTKDYLYRPFHSNLKGNTIISSSGDNGLYQVLKRFEKEKNITTKNTFIYASIDTNILNLRIALIPPSIQKRFFDIRIGYERVGPPDKSKGILQEILSQLPKNYNLWNLKNETFASNRKIEKGEVKFIFQDTTSKQYSDGECLQNTKKVFNRFVLKENKVTIDDPYNKNNNNNITYFNPQVEQISLKNVKESLFEAGASNQAEFDLFLSYSSSDREHARFMLNKIEEAGLNCFIDVIALRTGDLFSDEIKKAILSSREFIVLCSPSSIKSEWVISEWGAAWALGKRITPILLRIDHHSLPGRLKRRNTLDIHNFDRFIEDFKNRN